MLGEQCGSMQGAGENPLAKIGRRETANLACKSRIRNRLHAFGKLEVVSGLRHRIDDAEYVGGEQVFSKKTNDDDLVGPKCRSEAIIDCKARVLLEKPGLDGVVEFDPGNEKRRNGSYQGKRGKHGPRVPEKPFGEALRAQ